MQAYWKFSRPNQRFNCASVQDKFKTHPVLSKENPAFGRSIFKHHSDLYQCIPDKSQILQNYIWNDCQVLLRVTKSSENLALPGA